MKTIDFFNNAADQWDQMVRHDESKINNLLKKVAVRPGQYILDVGTGTGVLIPFLLEWLGEDGAIVAVDISEKMIEKARQKITDPRVSFLILDIEKASLPGRLFDVIFCYSVFPHFSNPEKALCNMHDLLAPGGSLVIMHSDSRETINDRHRRIGGPVGGHELPAVVTLQEAGLRIGFLKMAAEETADYYFLHVKKPYTVFNPLKPCKS